MNNLNVQQSETPTTVWLLREQQQRKIFAFVVTTCTCFLLVCLMWPLSNTGFVSQATISIRVGDDETTREEFQDHLVDRIGQYTQGDHIAQLVARVAAKRQLNNESFANLDVEAIRDSLSVQLLPSDIKSRVKLDFVFEGGGTPDEAELVKLLANDLSHTLLQDAYRSKDSLTMMAMSRPSASPIDAEKIQKLVWLVSQFESDLIDVRQSVLDLATQDNSDSTQSPFRNTSHRSSQPGISQPTSSIDTIQQTLESIDIESLRDQLAELKQSSSNRPIVDDPTHSIEMHLGVPVDGVPRSKSMFWIALCSVAFGSVVAIGYRPFSDRGFESVSRVATALKIPVVASLPRRETGSAPTTPIPLANRVVAVAKLLALGILVVTIGFCLINQEVRTAFIENPFYGFSRIVWMFGGS